MNMCADHELQLPSEFQYMDLCQKERYQLCVLIRQAKSSSSAAFLRMTLPGVIFRDQRSRSIPLGTLFGHDDEWSRFVKAYIVTASSGWKTLDDAEKWFFGVRFVSKMNRIWKMVYDSRLARKRINRC